MFVICKAKIVTQWYTNHLELQILFNDDCMTIYIYDLNQPHINICNLK